MRRSLLAGLGLVALLGVAAPASSTPDATTGVTRVQVVMDDFSFALARKAVPRGTTVFRVTNEGEVIHDFKIAGKKTPIYEAGQGGTLRVVFKKAGRYPFICTVPGHVAAGMKGVLRVT
jgi:uncharacterized cupredoxin-like copper-binding protein